MAVKLISTTGTPTTQPTGRAGILKNAATELGAMASGFGKLIFTPFEAAIGVGALVLGKKEYGQATLKDAADTIIKVFNPSNLLDAFIVQPLKSVARLVTSPAQEVKTFEEQPVTELLNFSILFSGLGKLFELGKFGKVSEIMKTAASYTDPLKPVSWLGKKTIGKLVLPEKIASFRGQTINDLFSTSANMSAETKLARQDYLGAQAKSLEEARANAAKFAKAISEQDRQLIGEFSHLHSADGVVDEIAQTAKEAYAKEIAAGETKTITEELLVGKAPEIEVAKLSEEATKAVSKAGLTSQMLKYIGYFRNKYDADAAFLKLNNVQEHLLENYFPRRYEEFTKKGATYIEEKLPLVMQARPQFYKIAKETFQKSRNIEDDLFQALVADPTLADFVGLHPIKDIAKLDFMYEIEKSRAINMAKLRDGLGGLAVFKRPGANVAYPSFPGMTKEWFAEQVGLHPEIEVAQLEEIMNALPGGKPAIWLMPKEAKVFNDTFFSTWSKDSLNRQLAGTFDAVNNVAKYAMFASPLNFMAHMFNISTLAHFAKFSPFNPLNWIKVPTLMKEITEKDPKYYEFLASGAKPMEFVVGGKDIRLAAEIFDDIDKNVNSSITSRFFRGLRREFLPGLGDIKGAKTPTQKLLWGYDTMMRYGSFRALRNMGETAADAGAMVSKYFVDYANLTDFERNIMRRAFFFYPWMKGSTGAIIDGIFQNPANARFLQLAGASVTDDRKGEGFFAIPMPDGKNINVKVTTPLFMPADLISNPLAFLFNKASPIVRSTAIAYGKQPYISKTTGEITPAELSKYPQEIWPGIFTNSRAAAIINSYLPFDSLSIEKPFGDLFPGETRLDRLLQMIGGVTTDARTATEMLNQETLTRLKNMRTLRSQMSFDLRQKLNYPAILPGILYRKNT